MKPIDDPLALELAQRIRDTRLDKRLNQAQVAEQLGVSVQTYSHFENCTRAISTGILFRLSEIFDVPIAVLLPTSIVTRSDLGAIDQKLDELLILWPGLTEAQRQAILGVARCFRA